MDRHRDEPLGVADHLALLDLSALFDTGFGRRADMLGQRDDQLLGQGALLDRQMRRPLFIVRRMNTGRKGF